MKPIAVIPMHDPNGIMFHHLEIIAPILKRVFAQVFASVTAVTQKAFPDSVTNLTNDSFFQVVSHETDISVGEYFITLYETAASTSQANQLLHLSFLSEFTLFLKDELQMKEVDWLAWEDPFILSRDPKQLKAERERSIGETRKRQAYVIPILQLLQGIDQKRA